MRPRYLFFILFTILLGSSLFVTQITGTAFGEITMENMVITRTNGRVVTFSVYKPVSESHSGPLPVILTIHGISSSRGSMSAFNIELARRNFTVVSVDLQGHGISSERFGFSTFLEGVYDAYDAVRYVQANDPRADSQTYGVLGHSLGAGVALIFQQMPMVPNATIIIGGGMGQEFGGLDLGINATSPRNLMIALGTWDELVSPQLAFDTLKNATGLSDVMPQVIYGSFDNGTARKLVFSGTDHLFEITDSVIVTNSLDWMIRSLQGSGQIAHTLAVNSHVYQIANSMSLLSTVSLALSLFPLYLIVYSFIPKQFHPKKTDSVYAIDGNIKFSTLVSGIAGVLLMLVTLMGFGFDFAGLALIPVSFGTTFVLYSALMFFIVHFLLNRKFGKSEYQTEAPPYSPNELLSELASVAIPVVIVAGWLVLWSIISIVVTGSQVGITPQVLSGATLPRGLYTIILTLLLIPWFYAEFHWLSSTVGLTVDVHDPKGNLRKVILLLTHRLGGTLIVIALFYVPFLAGVQLGLIMFIALLMLPLTLFFALFALMTLWVGHVTRNALATALFNAFILAVIVAATFQLV